METFASYGASKAALSVFSKVMRMELSDWGVHVALIQPGGFRTSMNTHKHTLSCCSSNFDLRVAPKTQFTVNFFSLS